MFEVNTRIRNKATGRVGEVSRRQGRLVHVLYDGLYFERRIGSIPERLVELEVDWVPEINPYSDVRST